MVNRRMCFRRLGHFVAGVLGIFYFGVDTVAIIATARNVPAIRHLLQHGRWSARRIDVLCGDEGKKASVKLDEIMI